MSDEKAGRWLRESREGRDWEEVGCRGRRQRHDQENPLRHPHALCPPPFFPALPIVGFSDTASPPTRSIHRLDSPALLRPLCLCCHPARLVYTHPASVSRPRHLGTIPGFKAMGFDSGRAFAPQRVVWIQGFCRSSFLPVAAPRSTRVQFRALLRGGRRSYHTFSSPTEFFSPTAARPCVCCASTVPPWPSSPRIACRGGGGPSYVPLGSSHSGLRRTAVPRVRKRPVLVMLSRVMSHIPYTDLYNRGAVPRRPTR